MGGAWTCCRPLYNAEVRANGAVAAVMACTGAVLCVPVPHSSGLVRSKDAVNLTVVHTETKLCPCTSLALCTATVGVSYCLLELRMTH